MIKIGVIGAGFMGRTHVHAYAKLPDIRIVTIAARQADQAETLAAEVGAAATTDNDRILDDPTLDAVSITVPTHLHRDIAIAALEAGKHILLEKPFALNLADCDAIMNAAQRTGRQLMIAHVVRFWPEYIAAIDLVHSGALGTPLCMVTSRLSTSPGWADWFANPALSGGAVLDMCIHDFDVLNWLFGAPQTVYARGREYRPGLWNQVTATVDYGGTSGTVEGSQFLPKTYPFSAGFRIFCENGTIEYSFQAGGASVEAAGGSNFTVYTPERVYTPGIDHVGAYDAQIAYFVECIQSGKPVKRGTPDQARLAVQTCLAARESLESGEVVHTVR